MLLQSALLIAATFLHPYGSRVPNRALSQTVFPVGQQQQEGRELEFEFWLLVSGYVVTQTCEPIFSKKKKRKPTPLT